jgi:hypothetical protein
MRQIFVFFLLVLISLSSMFSRNERYNPAEIFILHENTTIYISFENYKIKDGWTPLVLSVGGVDCLLWMDASGRVSEWQEIQDHPFALLCFIDPLNQTLEKGTDILYFDVYEQNPMRTRWQLSPIGAQGKLTKQIRFHEGGIDFYLGNLRLSLHQVSCDFTLISPGLFQVQFNGAMLAQYQHLLYEKATGIIYSTPVGNTTVIPRQSLPWAIKLEEPGKQTIGGK